jgi:two-component system sensor histidine kinase RpfC
MRDVAHAIRGVAENVGAMRLVDRCRHIMKLGSPQLALDAMALIKDLDGLVEDSARQARAELGWLLAPGSDRSDHKPGIPDKR